MEESKRTCISSLKSASTMLEDSSVSLDSGIYFSSCVCLLDSRYVGAKGKRDTVVYPQKC